MKTAIKNVGKLIGYNFGCCMCCLLLVETTVASPVDVSFGFGSTLNINSPAVGSANNWGLIYEVGTTTGAGVGNISWSNAETRISLNGTSFGSVASTGFYHDSVFGFHNGMVAFESNTEPHTFGIIALPAVGRNNANFHNRYSSGDLGQDSRGVVGFRSSEGNWGYIEFNWNEAESTLTVLSAKVETISDTPITFTPSDEASEDRSIPVSFGFGATLSTDSPAISGANNWGLIYEAGTTIGAGVGYISWSNAETRISLNGTSFGPVASTGFYHDSVFSSGNGIVAFEVNTVPHVFGINTLPAVGRNNANFHSQYSAGDLGQDSHGVVGFRSSEGNWGYIEFDWSEAGNTLTVLSARVQPTPDTPITFTPSIGNGAGHDDGTLDITFAFGTTLNANSPLPDHSTSYGKILTTDTLGNRVAAGVGNLGWTATADQIILTGASFGSSVASGLFHDEVFGSNNGKVVFENNTTVHTFGIHPLPNSTGRNIVHFHNNIYSGGDLGQNATGVVGFLSTAGNWGYIEFDWNESTSTLTVLSAKIQRFTGQPITFTPSAGATH